MNTRTQYLVAIAQPGRPERREWFTPSASLMTDDDTPADGALLAAQEWNDTAFCSLVRDPQNNHKPVTRTV